MDGSNTTTIYPNQEVVMLPASTSGTNTLMEIQAQTEEISRDSDEKEATYQVYLLRQPEEPVIEVDEDYLVITPPTGAYRIRKIFFRDMILSLPARAGQNIATKKRYSYIRWKYL